MGLISAVTAASRAGHTRTVRGEGGSRCAVLTLEAVVSA